MHLVCYVNIGFLVYAEPIILSRFEAKGLELCAEVSRQLLFLDDFVLSHKDCLCLGFSRNTFLACFMGPNPFSITAFVE